MGIVKGIDAISKIVDGSNSEKSDRPKAKWFGLKDGESAKIRFLQEFDENVESFNPEQGLMIFATEHSAPSDFRTKALCTRDEGPCFGCEMNHKDNMLPKEERTNKWFGKTSMYANVLVMPSDGDPYVAILRQGVGPKSITPTLIEISNEYGGITNSLFRIKRNGADFNNTSYSLVILPNKADEDVSEYDLYDLEAICTRSVPYEEQPKFYGMVEEDSEEEGTSEDTTDIAW
jgi:hypothetical protein